MVLRLILVCPCGCFWTSLPTTRYLRVNARTLRPAATDSPLPLPLPLPPLLRSTYQQNITTPSPSPLPSPRPPSKDRRHGDTSLTQPAHVSLARPRPRPRPRQLLTRARSEKRGFPRPCTLLTHSPGSSSSPGVSRCILDFYLSCPLLHLPTLSVFPIAIPLDEINQPSKTSSHSHHLAYVFRHQTNRTPLPPPSNPLRNHRSPSSPPHHPIPAPADPLPLPSLHVGPCSNPCPQ